MKRLTDTEFDVLVLGSGLSGCILGSILARHGHDVLIVDKGVHPRFTIGESTIPQTSQLIQLLARKYDVPELAVLGLKSPAGIREVIGPTSGVKRVVGFAYHRLGEEFSPEHGHHFGNVWRTENHLFRQDVDAWLLRVALGYGCNVVQGVPIERVDVDDDGTRVIMADGSVYSGRFVVDGSGHRSEVAKALGLREDPCPLLTNTRSMFTHVIGVRDFEDVATSYMSHRYREGTLHHAFEGGWFWVIPFDNWQGSTNPLVSLGLTLDCRTYPLDPSTRVEDEFESFLERVPSVARQLADAQAVRPWTRTGRIQYSSTRAAGARFALLSHAAGFIDPLYSRGLISTVESIDAICEALLPALDDDDFSDERFEPVDVVEQRALSFTDRLVSASYASWDDFELWNLWVRVWGIGVHVVESHLGSVLAMGEASTVQRVEDPILSEFEEKNYRKYFEASFDVMSRYSHDELTVDEARTELARILEGYEFQMPLRDRREGQEWAMKHPMVRDLFLGVEEQHARWMKEAPDPALMEPEAV